MHYCSSRYQDPLLCLALKHSIVKIFCIICGSLSYSEFYKVQVLSYQQGNPNLKLRTVFLSLYKAPCIGQGDALRTIFPLLLSAPLPLSCLGTAGKLQAHSRGGFRQVCESQSVAFCHHLALATQKSSLSPKTESASSQVQF